MPLPSKSVVHPRSTDRRVLFVLVAFIVVAILRYASWPWEGALAGQRESRLRWWLGIPSREWPGHYGGAEGMAFGMRFKGPIKSRVYDRLFGEVYVSFEKQAGEWIVIHNSYLASGLEF